MKKISLLICVASGIMLSSFSCNKEKEKEKTPTSSPYYFTANYDGKSINFTSTEPQYKFIEVGTSGGYQTPSPTELYPSIELFFQFTHPPTDADIKKLEGKTIGYYFYSNSDSVVAHLNYDETFESETQFCDQSEDNAYGVTINKVTFVKSTTAIGIPIDVYEINGTCRAKLGDSKKPLENGKFNMIIARRTDQ